MEPALTTSKIDVSAQALQRLAQDLAAGKASGEVVDEAEVYRLLGVEPE